MTLHLTSAPIPIAEMVNHQGPKCSYLLHLLGRAVTTLAGWQVIGRLPDCSRMVVIGAPHTSNWDFFIMLMAVFVFRVKVRWLGKHTLFFPPLGSLLRALGGIATDRSGQHDLVRVLRDRFATEERFVVVIAPEGTRGNSDHWRSGFYAIAEAAEVPVVCGFVDYPTRRVGMGLTFWPRGQRREDMDLCREFYSDKRGRYPSLASPVRLRDEG